MPYRSFKEWLLVEEIEEIPVGTRLFHGTLETFPQKQLGVGGYDRILWLTNDPQIAQSYIPLSGSFMVIGADSLTRPRQEKELQNLQRFLGINYDYNEVEWGKDGRPKSYKVPDIWLLREPKNHHFTVDEDERIRYVVNALEKAGWVADNPDSPPEWRRYRIHTKNVKKGEFMMPGRRRKGRLFVVTVKQPLKVFDFTSGGRLEGDLTDPDYHKVNQFRKLEEEGYDGVKINDFAQVQDWGNIGHRSIGVFAKSIGKLQWEVITASHPVYDINKMTTPEYDAYLKRKSV